jgi:hypothetical protein
MSMAASLAMMLLALLDRCRTKRREGIVVIQSRGGDIWLSGLVSTARARSSTGTGSSLEMLQAWWWRNAHGRKVVAASETT